MSGTHTDITERKQTEILSDQMVVFAEEMLKTGKEQITSEKILENLLFISKAKYGVLTLKSNITNKFTTVAVAGIKNNVKKLSKLLGFELVGREWDDYSEKNRNPEGQVVSFYSSITESIERVNYKNLSSPFEKLFDLGETVVTKIIIENEVIGEFRLIMPYGQKFKMDSFVEIYSRQIDMFFTRKKVENALIEANHRQEMANAAGGVGIWNLNLTTNELTWDDQMFALYGITRKQFTSVYQAWISGLHPEDAERGDREIQMAARGEKEFDTEFRVVWPDGTIHHINARAQVRRDGTGKPLEMIGTNYDITNRKRAEEAVLHLSYHDQLTGLFNRRFFEEEIKRLDTDRQLPLSIIVGDLNNLKLTNDTFGHLEGDRLLKETSKLLKTACRSDDILARWGGDEFVILLPKTSIASAEEIAQRIEKGCSELFIQKIPIGLAIGIAAKTKHRQNIEDIILEAESNMYKNKLAGKQGNAGSVILALEQALYEKSNETMEHAQRLKELSLKLGKKLKLHSHQLDELSLFASLHDIGKVAVPETILLKEGALSEKEWEVIKRHSETGFNIAQSSPQIAHIAKYILSCHENWDGSGYPVGLAKEEIPLLSRIVFIADSYDIMTCKRTYKTAMSKEGAVIELKRCAGTQFDPMLVEKFLEVLAEQAK
ncbi:MAG: diguanylate cyclase [Actinomycetota bacterium]